MNRTGLIAGLAALLLAASAGMPLTAQETGDDTGNDSATEDESWDVSSPPGEKRDIPINVDEGTWMNLDVSPDGGTIVFDLLGDIYAMPASGGEATALTSGLAWDMQPRFSPDGSQIAFTSDRGAGDNVWIMDADGSNPVQLTQEDFRLLNNPSWSPDGRYIAARKHFTTGRSLGTGEVWLYHVDGGKGVAIVERPGPQHQKELGEPHFGPDGKWLYYSLNVTPGGRFVYAQDSNTELFQIRRVDLETGEVETVAGGEGGAVRPAVSPDGRTLAYVKRVRAQSKLFVKDLTSGIERMIYEDMDQDMQESWAVQGVYPNIDWTPDSSGLVFWAKGKIRHIDVETGETRVIPFTVNDTRTVIEPPRPGVDVAPDTFETAMVRWPQTSPDGQTIVFESTGKLWVKDIASGEISRLTGDEGDHFELYPAFSRDGNWVVFTTWDDEELGSVRKVRAGGGASQILTADPGHYVFPAFSPDGQTIVFEKVEGGYLRTPEWSVDPGIYRISAAGGTATRISDEGHQPHFGNRNDRVFVMTGGEDEVKLTSMTLDGLDLRDHAVAEFAREMRVSPDGKYVAAVENFHVHVAALAPGGKPVGVGRMGGATAGKKLSRTGGEFAGWSTDSRHVTWALGPVFKQADIEAALSDEDWEAPEDGISLSRTVTAPHPDGLVALTGARILTMDDDSSVIENGVILVNGNRIEAVGRAGDIAIPDSATAVDMAGKTILPGLVDAHAHGAQATNDIVPQQNWLNQATLALGVTTIHDPSNRASGIFAAAELQKAGLILAPRIYSTGEIVYGARSSSYVPIDSYEDALAAVRRLKAQGAISIKNYNQPRRDQRQMVAAASRAENLLVVPEGGALYNMDMSLIADGNSSIEHTLPNEAIYEDVLQFWGQTDVAFTQTLVVLYGGLRAEDYFYAREDVWKHPLLSDYVPPRILQARSVRRETAPETDYSIEENATIARQLGERGVLINTGAHGQREGLATHWEIWSLAMGGISYMDALKAATANPAKHMGMWADIGSIEAGKLADLTILNSNPLDDIRNSDDVSHVMLNGRLYESATLNEVYTGDFRTRPLFWESLPGADIR